MVKSFELSLWQDVYNDQTGEFKEERVCTIGSDKLSSPIGATDIQLTTKVNGELSLKFTMHYDYLDPITNEAQNNDFVDLLRNESKLKLYYDDKWYDFIIKNIQKTSKSHSYSYTCQGAPVLELSKNGFSVSLSEAQANNSGTAKQLLKKVLQNTDWEVDEESIERVEYQTERLMPLILTKSIKVKQISNQSNNSFSDDDSIITIPASTRIYAFTNTLNEDSLIFQFIGPNINDLTNEQIESMDDGSSEDSEGLEDSEELDNLEGAEQITDTNENYLYDKNGVMTHENSQYYCYYKTGTTWLKDVKYDFAYPGFTVVDDDDNSLDYKQGERIILTPLRFYSKKLKKYLNLWENHSVGTTSLSNTYYGCSMTTNIGIPNIGQSIITNGEDFSSDGVGWELLTNGINNPEGQLEAKTLMSDGETDLTDYTSKRTKIDSEALVGVNSLLHWTKIDNLSYLVNSGLTDNLLYLQQYPRLTEWVLQIKAETINCIIEPKVLIDGQIYNLSFKDSTVSPPSQFDQDSGLNSWIVTLPEELFNTTSTPQFAFLATTLDENAECKLKYCSLFPFMGTYTDDRGDIAYYSPTKIPINMGVKWYYDFYPIVSSDGFDLDDLSEIDVEENSVGQFTLDNLRPSGNDDDMEWSFGRLAPVYSNLSVRTITVSQSNYFNIAQSICEAFKCWLELNVEHDEDGNILSKKVKVREYINNPNYAGLHYGINLSSITRTIESNNLVTKLIVKDNTNANAINGFCSISRSASNPIRDNVIYNFDYYVNQGLIDKNMLLKDLYDRNSGVGPDLSIQTEEDEEPPKPNLYGFVPRLSNINSNLVSCSDYIISTSNNILNLERQLTLYTSEREAARKEYDKLSRRDLDFQHSVLDQIPCLHNGFWNTIITSNDQSEATYDNHKWAYNASHMQITTDESVDRDLQNVLMPPKWIIGSSNPEKEEGDTDYQDLAPVVNNIIGNSLLSTVGSMSNNHAGTYSIAQLNCRPNRVKYRSFVNIKVVKDKQGTSFIEDEQTYVQPYLTIGQNKYFYKRIDTSGNEIAGYLVNGDEWLMYYSDIDLTQPGGSIEFPVLSNLENSKGGNDKASVNFSSESIFGTISRNLVGLKSEAGSADYVQLKSIYDSDSTGNAIYGDKYGLLYDQLDQEYKNYIEQVYDETKRIEQLQNIIMRLTGQPNINLEELTDGTLKEFLQFILGEYNDQIATLDSQESAYTTLLNQFFKNDNVISINGGFVYKPTSIDSYKKIGIIPVIINSNNAMLKPILENIPGVTTSQVIAVCVLIHETNDTVTTKWYMQNTNNFQLIYNYLDNNDVNTTLDFVVESANSYIRDCLVTFNININTSTGIYKDNDYIVRGLLTVPVSSLSSKASSAYFQWLYWWQECLRSRNENQENGQITTKLAQFKLAEFQAQQKIDIYNTQKTTQELQLRQLKERYEQLTEYKNLLNKLFYQKYRRFIHEGTWTNTSSYNDDSYYFDALTTLQASCVPKVSYNIDVTDVSMISDFKDFIFKVGDETTITDPSFFGYEMVNNKLTNIPKTETVIVTEINYNLSKPESTKFKVQTYKTQFADLFSQIAATVQSVQYNAGDYSAAASFLSQDSQENADFISKALNNAQFKISMGTNFVWDNDGLKIQDNNFLNKYIWLSGSGLMLSDDGGVSWSTGITADGISADHITSGTINTNQLQIMCGDDPTFKWDALGLTAYDLTFGADGAINAINTRKGVRFDHWGIYGCLDLLNSNPTNLNDIHQNSTFALTWRGLSVYYYKDGWRYGSVEIGNNESEYLIDICKGDGTHTFTIDENGVVTINAEGEVRLTRCQFDGGTINYATIGGWEVKDGALTTLSNIQSFEDGSSLYGYNSILRLTGDNTYLALLFKGKDDESLTQWPDTDGLRDTIQPRMIFHNGNTTRDDKVGALIGIWLPLIEANSDVREYPDWVDGTTTYSQYIQDFIDNDKNRKDARFLLNDLGNLYVQNIYSENNLIGTSATLNNIIVPDCCTIEGSGISLEKGINFSMKSKETSIQLNETKISGQGGGSIWFEGETGTQNFTLNWEVKDVGDGMNKYNRDIQFTIKCSNPSNGVSITDYFRGIKISYSYTTKSNDEKRNKFSYPLQTLNNFDGNDGDSATVVKTGRWNLSGGYYTLSLGDEGGNANKLSLTTAEATKGGLNIEYFDGNNVKHQICSIKTIGTGTNVIDSKTLATISKKKLFTSASIIPNSNQITLGAEDTNRRWAGIYIKDGVTVNSDRRLKNNISPINNLWNDIFDNLQPVQYILNSDELQRTHFGFIAQDIQHEILKKALNPNEYYIWSENCEKYQSLCYDEFISLCVLQIQQLKNRVTDLETQLEKFIK